jgi:hypothetical protein
MNLITNETNKPVFLDKIHEIYKVLKNNYTDKGALMGGNSGMALFMFYYGREFQNEEAIDIGGNFLLKNLDIINELGFGLAGGKTGVFWVINHLIKNNFIEIDEKVRSSGIEILKKQMNSFLHNNNFDYLHGALGITLYLLEYQEFSSDSKNHFVFEEVVNELEKLAIIDNLGIRWRSTVDIKNPKIVYNFSLSHGMSSIIVILSKIHNLGINKNKCLKLINGCIKFMTKFENESHYISRFPSYIPENLTQDYIKPSKIAWCYGDLGMAMAFLITAYNIKDKELEKYAIDLLSHTSKRRGLEENAVHDGMFCHGTVGNAHLFNRAFQYTGIEDYKKASIYWFNETFKMANFKDGLAGFKSFKGIEYGGWVNDYALLEGISGIGLSLLAAVTESEPKWDNCFLIS